MPYELKNDFSLLHKVRMQEEKTALLQLQSLSIDKSACMIVTNETVFP